MPDWLAVNTDVAIVALSLAVFLVTLLALWRAFQSSERLRPPPLNTALFPPLLSPLHGVSHAGAWGEEAGYWGGDGGFWSSGLSDHIAGESHDGSGSD